MSRKTKAFLHEMSCIRVWDPARDSIGTIHSSEFKAKGRGSKAWNNIKRTGYILNSGNKTFYAQCFGVN